MPEPSPFTIRGFFHDRTTADKALGQLAQSGFRANEVTVTAVGPPKNSHSHPPSHQLRARGVAMLGGLAGAMIGSLVGVGLGAGLTGLFANAAVAGIVGALIGTAVAGVFGAFVGWALAGSGFDFYSRDLHAGRVLVVVRGTAGFADAHEILRRNGADIEEHKPAEGGPPAPAAPPAPGSSAPVTGQEPAPVP